MKLSSLRRLFHKEPFKYDLSLYDLTEGEAWWRERNSLFESHGYRLRGRLRPGWIPSFSLDPRLHPGDCEDSSSRSVSHRYFPKPFNAMFLTGFSIHISLMPLVYPMGRALS